MVPYTTANFEWRNMDYSQGPKPFAGNQPTRVAVEIYQNHGKLWNYIGKWHPGLRKYVRRRVFGKPNTNLDINSIRFGEFDQNGVVWNPNDPFRAEWARSYYAVPNNVINRLNAYGKVYATLHRKKVLIEKKIIWVCPALFSGRSGLSYATFVRDSARGIMRNHLTGTDVIVMTNILNEKGMEFFGVRTPRLPAHFAPGFAVAPAPPQEAVQMRGWEI